MADIASINGQDVPSGTGGVSESNTGVLYFEAGGFNVQIPYADKIFAGQGVSLYKAQLDSRTDIVKIDVNRYSWWGLSSSNVLYSAGYSSNIHQLGRTASTTNTSTAAWLLKESLTNVAKFTPHQNGAFAIKTDGTLWWCGSISNYANSSDTGQSTNNVNYGWLQFGSDTDWVDLISWTGYPTTVFAIKGTGSSKYLYVAGQNATGKTAQNTTSGTTKPFTRVLTDDGSGGTTNWAKNPSKFDLNYDYVVVVTDDGEFWACGEGQYGALGQGNTTDSRLMIRVGSDSDWDRPFAPDRYHAYCQKTDGTLYGSTDSLYRTTLRASTVDRTYRLVNSDTDWQEIIGKPKWTSASGTYLYLIKKGGAWYFINRNSLNAFQGGSTSSNSTLNDLIAFNTFMQGNDVTGTIVTGHINWKNGSSNTGNEVLTLVVT